MPEIDRLIFSKVHSLRLITPPVSIWCETKGNAARSVAFGGCGKGRFHEVSVVETRALEYTRISEKSFHFYMSRLLYKLIQTMKLFREKPIVKLKGIT